MEMAEGQAKGTTIEIPPGSLAIGTDVSMAEVNAPDEFSGTSMAGASAAVEISAVDADGKSVAELSAPMTIAIPYSGGAALMGLTGVDRSGDNLCALLKSATGLYLWRRAALAIDTEARKASFQSMNLGVFQLVYCGNEPMEGFKDASAAGVGGNLQSVATKIDTAAYGFGLDHYCILLIAEAPGDGKSGGLSKILGSSTAAISGETIEIKTSFSSEAIGADDEALVVIAAQSKVQACDSFKTGSNLEDLVLEFGRVFAFKYSKDDFVANKASGALGDGEMALKSLTVAVGAPEKAGFSPGKFLDKGICIHLKGEKEFSETAASVESGGTIDGNRVLTVLSPARGTEDSKLEISVGGVCGPNNKDEQTKELEPYHLSFGNVPFGSEQYITPIEISTNPLYGSGIACLNLLNPGSDLSRSGGEGSLVRFNITIGKSNQVFVPWIGAATPPQYDLLLQPGTSCLETSSNIPAIPFKSQTLSSSLSL
jgi:hypothetical protein